jgi:ABC-2 type transport system permease protein
MRLGRFFQGLIILLWGATALDMGLLSYQSLVIVMSIVGTACLFYGLMIIQGAICFWTMESLELMNITTFGAMETGQYPMTIYNMWFRMFFTFLIPLACVVYYPIATALLHETFPLWTAMVFPTVGVLFLWLSSLFWKFGVSRYHSTGN